MDASKQKGAPPLPDAFRCLVPNAGPPVRKAARCLYCGRNAVSPVAQPGRMLRYRNAALTLPADLLIPTCRRCRQRLLSFEAMPELQAQLEATYRAELRERAAVEITRLGHTYSQRVVEVELALLAAEPARLEELRRYWALPVDASPAADDGNVLR